MRVKHNNQQPNNYYNLIARLASATLIALICLYKFQIASVMPLSVSMFHYGDDTWFFLKAVSIFSGDWLGNEYDLYTLIKGAGYPGFLAFCAKLGINPRIATDILYITACLVFYRVLRLININRAIAIAGFSLIVMNPVTLSTIWSGLVRQTLYLPLSILFLSSLIAIIHCAAHNKHYTKSLPWFFLCTISLAIAWNTREESIWMALTALPVFIFVMVRSIQAWAIANLVGNLIGVTLAALTPYAVTTYIAQINLDKYGVEATVDFKEPTFSRAWNAILSLNTQPSIYNIDSIKGHTEDHWNLETLEKLLKISDATRLVIHQLITEDQTQYKVYETRINGGIGIWSLKHALHSAGYYRDGPSTLAFLETLADDIEKYCDDSPLNCNPPIVSLVQWKEGHWGKLWPAAVDILRFATQFPDEYQIAPKSIGDMLANDPFKYALSRFFSLNSNYVQGYENLRDDTVSAIQSEDIKKWSSIRVNLEWYQKYLPSIFLLTMVLLLVTLSLKAYSFEFMCIIGTVIIAFSLIFGINLLVVVTAYFDITRTICGSTIALLMLIPIVFGLFYESAVGALVSIFCKSAP